MSFSKDGKTLASGSIDNTIKLWNVSTGKELKTFKLSEAAYRLALLPDGKTLFSQGNNNTKFWEISTGNLIKTVVRKNRKLNKTSHYWAGISPDGKIFATRNHFSNRKDGIIRLWESSTGALLQTLKAETYDYKDIAFSLDSKLLASKGDNTIKLWDVSTGKELKKFTYSNFVNQIAFLPGGKLLAFVRGDDNQSILNIREAFTGKLMKTLNTVRHVAEYGGVVSPDGNILAFFSTSAETNIEMILWNVSTGKEIKISTGHSDFIWKFQFSPDNKTFTSGTNKTTKLWEASTGKLIKTFGKISRAFSPNGKILASGNLDKTVKLWEASTGKLIKTLTGSGAVVFSPDGKLFASGSHDKTIKIWSVE